MPNGKESNIFQNRILAGLPPDELSSLLPHLEPVSQKWNEVLCREGERIERVYFPQQAVILQFASLKDGSMVEVAGAGSEGMIGIRAALGAETWNKTAIVQVPGDCLRLRADVLVSNFRRSHVLQQRLLHYAGYVVTQLGQSAACNRVHLLRQRLCRWLLSIYMRAGREEFPATHECISHSLGASRSEVSTAARNLYDDGLIVYRRGRMRILNVNGLENASCECYQLTKNELEKFYAACKASVLAFPAKIEAPGLPPARESAAWRSTSHAH